MFSYNATATSTTSTLSLHDALPISRVVADGVGRDGWPRGRPGGGPAAGRWRAGGGLGDRKSTRLNSSHVAISYAVFCMKKKNQHFSQLHRENISQQDQINKIRMLY